MKSKFNIMFEKFLPPFLFASRLNEARARTESKIVWSVLPLPL